MTPTSARWKLVTIAAITLALAVLLVLRAPFLNGPAYWKWPWRRIAAWPYLPAMLLCAAPLFGAIFAHGSTLARRAFAIGMIMLSMFAMQIAHIAMSVSPPSLSRIIYFVESPMNTSYFSDALRTMDDHATIELLANYSGYMPQFYMHGQEKPPGPILFFRTIIGIVGTSNVDRAALIAGIVIGVLATLVVPATYLLVRTLVRDDHAALLASAMIALCPGEIFNFPVLDQLYPIGACLLIVAWIIALRTAKPQAAVAFGFLLAGCLFVVYHFLVLGAFLGAATIAFAWTSSNRVAIARNIGVALLTVAVLYLILGFITGFKPVLTFQTALVEQHNHLVAMDRPYPKTIVFDLTDFALGSVWIPALLAIFALCRERDDSRLQKDDSHLQRDGSRLWVVLCLSQILLLALTGLMQAETARIWCFLLPLLMLPAGCELSRWARPMQATVLGMMWLLMSLVGMNMRFMY